MQRDEDIAAFVAERNAALLSLDEAVIRAYAVKWKAPLPAEPWVFWAAVHSARVHITNLPMEARTLSKRWLRDNGAERLLAQVPADVPG